ncbi:DUF4410 domain-containing protein [Paracraurococcus lichenis]|uniref:DUF4410 domain-containing protein n=1 Tax=Paracraurococcus lichenis TaxID=3064888 RepID=A0ABT9E198_9PROT|nr:DUF4410 domain-containing protein [Paracraurococcus sp. LOR1-02]MDO9709946.1 DUF4410 domain-containing protein [Paracraurococcus sp. LOR1-02]
MASPLGLGRRPLLRTVLLGTLPGLAACGQPQVTVERAYAGPRLPQPSRILVRDFAVAPDDVRLDSGFRGRVEQSLSAASPTDQRLAAARAAASTLAEALTQALRATPDLPVERVPPGAPPMPGRTLLVDGRLLAVDEGNRTQRVLIGFGRGESRMAAEADLLWIEAGAAPRLIETLDSDTDSGRAPGLAAGLGVGAAARRLATSAAVGGGVHAAIEGSRADDADEARRIGTALGARLREFLAQQGWIAPRQ